MNRDSTISVWDEMRMECLAEISLFADGEWCIVSLDGRFASSERAEARVNIFVDGSLVADKEPYRMGVAGSSAAARGGSAAARGSSP